MTAQGHNTGRGKPYEEVGKPLYLNSKRMIQGSLGQDSAVRRSHENSKERKMVIVRFFLLLVAAIMVLCDCIAQIKACLLMKMSEQKFDWHRKCRKCMNMYKQHFDYYFSRHYYCFTSHHDN